MPKHAVTDQRWVRGASGHRVNNNVSGQVGSGHGSLPLTRFRLGINNEQSKQCQAIDIKQTVR